MKIFQAFYGESGGSHRKLYSQIEDEDLNNFLLRYTDRPGTLPVGIDMKPYFAGERFRNYFLFSKTLPVTNSDRAGLVFTHVIILNLSEALEKTDLSGLFTLFENKIPTSFTNIEHISYENLALDITNHSSIPEHIKIVISHLLSGKRPVIFIGPSEDMVHIIIHLWRGLPIRLKEQLRFGVCFNPSDERSDMDILNVQENLQPLWKHHTNSATLSQSSLNSEISLSAKSILGIKEGQVLIDFISELGVNITSFDMLHQAENGYTLFQKVEQNISASDVRHLFKIISKLSSNKINGSKIKSIILNRLIALTELGGLNDVYALGNMDCTAYDNGEKKIADSIKNILAQNLINIDEFSTDLIAKIANKASEVRDARFLWWSNAVTDSFKDSFQTLSVQKAKILLQISNNQELVKKLLTSAYATPQNEECLIQVFNNKLSEATLNETLSVVKEKNWLLLHAVLVLTNYPPEEAVEKQAEIEKLLPIGDSIGLNYISDHIDPAIFIEKAISSGSEKLIDISVSLCLAKPILLNRINVENQNWQKIWLKTLTKSKDIKQGLKNPQEVVDKLFDCVIDGKPVEKDLMDFIAFSEFANVAYYPQRSALWQFLGSNNKPLFIEATGKSYITDYVTGKENGTRVENEIGQWFKSVKGIREVLRHVSANTERVILWFFNFNSDSKAVEELISAIQTISVPDAVHLGKLIFKSQSKQCAKRLLLKAKQFKNFSFGLVECKELLSTWDRITNNDLVGEQFTQEELLKIQHENSSIVNNLPTVVILTAIQEEYQAVHAYLEDIEDFDQNDTTYEKGVFIYQDVPIAKVIIRECGQSNSVASLETERAIQYFHPKAMFFVGIAGSRKSQDFVLGDVIFPDKIYSYEAGKSDKDVFMARPEVQHSTFTICELAKKERRKVDWKVFIKGDWSDIVPNWEHEVKANIGVIASGEKIIEHYYSGIGDVLSKHYNDTSAVETEGFGFANAASRQGSHTRNMLIGVVRGISDVLQKNEYSDPTATNNRPSGAKRFASATAAAFTFWLIYRLHAENKWPS